MKRFFDGCRSAAGHTRRRAMPGDPGAVFGVRVPAVRTALASLLLLGLAALAFAPPAFGQRAFTYSPDTIDEGATVTLSVTMSGVPSNRDKARINNGAQCAASLLSIGTVGSNEFPVSGGTGTISLSVTAGSVTADQNCRPSYAMHNPNTSSWASGISAQGITIRNVVPAYSSAAVNGSTLTVGFTSALDTAHTPDTGDFTVSGGDSPSPTVTAVGFKSGDATKVELTLSRAVEYGETGVTLAYTPNAMDAKKLQNADGDVVAAFSGNAVTNKTPFASLPAGSVSFTVTHPSLTFGSNQPQFPASATATPGPGAGEITVTWTAAATGPAVVRWLTEVKLQGATAYPPAHQRIGVRCDETTARTCTITGLSGGTAYDVGLLLRSADNSQHTVNALNIVTLTSIVPPGSVSFTTTGGSIGGAAPSPPARATATPGPAATEITVEWEPAVGSTATEWSAQARPRSRGGDNFLNSDPRCPAAGRHPVSRLSCMLTGLTAGTAYDIRMSLNAGTGNFRRIWFRNVVTKSGTAPAVSSAAVNGNTLTVTFAAALDTAHVPLAPSFTVTGGNSPARTVTAAAFKTGDATKLELTLSRAVVYGETGVKVAYAKPGGVTRRLQDAAANEVAAFSNQAVTNDTPYVPPSGPMDFETPGTTTGTNPPGVPRTATVTPGPGDGQISVAWEVPLTGTQGNAANVSVRESGSTGQFHSEINCKATLAGSTFVCTVTSLTPGASYTVRLVTRIINSDRTRTLLANNIIAKDSTVPAFSSASVVDATLTVGFSEALDTAHLPAKGQFTVSGGNSPAPTVTAVRFKAGDSSTLELTLSRAVLGNEPDNFMLTYAQPTPLQDRLQDTAGNFVVGFTEKVTVNSIAIKSAAVNGTELTLKANRPLDESFTPPNASFSVAARSPGGTSRTIAGAGGTVAISGRTVTVALAEAVAWDDTVTAAYVPPGSSQKPLIGMGGSGAPLPGFTGLAAPNGTPPPVVGAGACTSLLVGSESTSPNAPSCSVESGPGQGQITLGWEPAEDGPDVERWHVDYRLASDRDASPKVNFTRSTQSALAASARRHVLSLTPGDAYDLRLRAEGPRWNVDYHVVEAKNVVAAADTTAPKLLETGGLTVDGATLTLAYDEALDAAHVPNKLYFTVAVAGRSRQVDSVRVSGSRVELVLFPAVRSGETVTLTYRKGHDPNPLQDAHGNKVADIENRAVTNATTAESLIELPVRSAVLRGTEVTVTFAAPLDETSVPNLTAFVLWRPDGGNVADPTGAVAISGSTVTVSFRPVGKAGTAIGPGWRLAYSSLSQYTGPSPLKDSHGRKLEGFSVPVTAPPPEVPETRPHITALAFLSNDDYGPGADGFYGIGEVIGVQATFNETVGVAGHGHGANRWTRTKVKIRLGPGRGTRWALWDSGNWSKTIVFAYTLQPTDMTPTGETPGGISVVEDSLDVSHGRIFRSNVPQDRLKPRPDSWASGTHAGLPADPNHKVGNVGLMADDTDPPVLQGALVLGKTLTLSFDETLSTAAVPPPGALTVRVDRRGTYQELPAKTLSVSGSRVVAGLYDVAPHDTKVTVKYDPPTDAAKRLKDASPAGNVLAAFDYTTVRNDTPLPAVRDASVDGTALTLTFDQLLDPDSTPRNTAFRVSATPAGGQSRTINGAAGDVAIDADDRRTVTVTLAQPVAGGETVTARYTPPSGSAAKLLDASGNAVAAFEGEEVFVATTPLPSMYAAEVTGDGAHPRVRPRARHGLGAAQRRVPGDRDRGRAEPHRRRRRGRRSRCLAGASARTSAPSRSG